MGKVKKFKPSQVAKNISLADQIETSNAVKIKNRKEKTRREDDDEVRIFRRNLVCNVVALSLFRVSHLLPRLKIE